ncbi:MAG: hypothetical protein HC918_14380 [Oscillatoriales cyanobacterium SM2_1_8]|nr:hypothetical protein [Oscillatoriales cyanobacterium SM2_1_8]
MAVHAYLERIRDGVSTWNHWRSLHADLRGIDLSAADLSASISGTST